VPTAWRIVKKKHQQEALTGEGARRYGGRWNTAGQSLIYAAATLSGALLEILVHSNRQLLSHYIVYRLVVPKRLVKKIDLAKLPETWRDSPAPPELAQIADQWYAQMQSAVVEVPNSIVPLEKNYLINPNHKDFRLIDAEGPIDYDIDPRLLSSSST